LGKAGIKVSVFSFGSWVNLKSATPNEEAVSLLEIARNAGVNFFDTAEAYASGEAEIVLGKAIKTLGWKRSDIVISTKIFWGGKGPNDQGLSFKHIVEGTSASLERLQLSYVDLIFAHRPDPETPIEETVRAFTHIINQGKAFYWGTSEWSAADIMEAYRVAREYNLIPPTMEQPQYNMFCRDRLEAEYAPLYSKHSVGLGTTIWSPLAYGILTGKYNDGVPEGSRLTADFFKDSKESLNKAEGQAKIEKVKQLTVIAKELDCTVGQLALAWCAKNVNVSTVILGASSAEQLRENLGAIQVLPKITQEILDRIEAILGNKPKNLPKSFRR